MQTKTNKSHRVLITFFPHATTCDNEAGISTGQAETPISILGKKQIQNLQKEVQGRQFDAVFSSDLSRAIQTATGAFGATHHITIDPRLREINIGELTGKPDNYTHPLSTQYIDQPFPAGESFKNVEARVRDFLNFLAKQYAGRSVAIVGHMATQLALDVALKNMTWPEAIEHDWRKTRSFQYGWEYALDISKNNTPKVA